MNNRSLKITFYSIVIFTIILFSFWFFFYKPNTSEKVEIESNASNEIKREIQDSTQEIKDSTKDIKDNIDKEING